MYYAYALNSERYGEHEAEKTPVTTDTETENAGEKTTENKPNSVIFIIIGAAAAVCVLAAVIIIVIRKRGKKGTK